MKDPDPARRLQLSKGQMQALGYRVVDLLVEHFTALDQTRVTGKGDPATLGRRLREPLPEVPAPFEAAIEKLERDVFPFMLHVDHPRFFAFVPGPSNFVGAMADA